MNISSSAAVLSRAERRQLRKENRQAARKERQAQRRAQRKLDRLADQQHDHDHDHDHDHGHDHDRVKIDFSDSRLSPDASPDSLIGGEDVNWKARVFTDRVKLTDNIFDVTISEVTMSPTAEAHILGLIQEIDSITGVQVAIERPGIKPDLVIEKTTDWSEYGSLIGTDVSRYAGLAFFDDDKVHATWRETTFASNGELSTETKYVIAHEVLHCFGLMHPGNDGYNPEFNSHDTVMSYTRSGNSQLTALDQAALAQLWG